MISSDKGYVHHAGCCIKLPELRIVPAYHTKVPEQLTNVPPTCQRQAVWRGDNIQSPQGPNTSPGITPAVERKDKDAPRLGSSVLSYIPDNDGSGRGSQHLQVPNRGGLHERSVWYCRG